MFVASKAERLAAFKLFNKTENSFSEDVEVIKKWIQTQLHLPKSGMSEKKIENFLLLNKCSIELAKEKIDAYFTIKPLAPDFFNNFHPHLPDQIHQRKINIAIILPKLTDDIRRIFIVKLLEPGQFSPINIMKQVLQIGELRLEKDCYVGEIIFVDMKEFTFEDVIRFNLSIIIKALNVYKKVYSMRFKAWYFINCKPIVSHFIAILKKLLKPKLMARIHCDLGTDSLKKYLLPADIPTDYGGEGNSLQELQDALNKELLDNKDLFDEILTIQTNESLRPEKLDNDEILGFHGHFKQLNID